MTKPKILTSAEAAALRGTTQRQIQRLAKAGVLPVFSRGPRGVLLFKASDVRRAPVSLA
jgi:DNA-binding transcriptional MerR regulator